jgi:hypothetical protein
MARLRALVASGWRLADMRRTIRRLEAENASLRAQNDSMRNGMRRCVTCEYRIEWKERQGT